MNVALFLDPLSHHFEGDRLFDAHDASVNRDNAILPFVYLRDRLQAQGVPVHTADRLLQAAPTNTLNIYISLGVRSKVSRLARRHDVICSAFFALECPAVEPRLYRDLPIMARYFKRVFSYADSTSLEPYVGRALKVEKFHVPQAIGAIEEARWRRADRGFLVMINRNKRPAHWLNELYTERLRAVEYFSRTREIDLYGMGWDEVPFQMGSSRLPGIVQRVRRKALIRWSRLRTDPLLQAARRVYRGPLESKAETLNQYRFAICFENMKLTGWVTEKLFDCFAAGTVPIYLGAPDIESYVPPECFIDMRRFRGYGELAAFLKSLSGRAVQRYRDNARAYLTSPQYHPFTKEAFADKIERIVQEDAGIHLEKPGVDVEKGSRREYARPQ